MNNEFYDFRPTTVVHAYIIILILFVAASC